MTDFASLDLKIDSREVGEGVRELDRLTDAGTRAERGQRAFTGAADIATRSAGQQRAGMQQLSFQIGDVAQQFALGVNPMVIFAQQGGQVVQALNLMKGGASGLVGFLAGPWGAVITGGALILGTMVSQLFNTKKGMDEVKFASNGMKDAQSILGTVIDSTTGKINAQNSALVALARAQLLVASVKARAARRPKTEDRSL